MSEFTIIIHIFWLNEKHIFSFDYPLFSGVHIYSVVMHD